MKGETTYARIDYAGLNSSVNRDEKTGIRYGVISMHSINPEALNDIYANGRDLNWENYIAEAKARLRSALSDYFSDTKYSGCTDSPLDAAAESAFDVVSDGISEQYEGDGSNVLYVEGNLSVQSCLDSDFMIDNSPFFTFAQFCSPCVPGACNLDSPIDNSRNSVDSIKCFCLGHDWFDDGKAPYPVYSVAEYLANNVLVEVKPA